ncbi:MAG: glycoside hydrolase family 18 protein [Treponema sp.]|jgi:chitinase|nr:glycoside hydrolase family 18 protein [Treponema sp.]
MKLNLFLAILIMFFPSFVLSGCRKDAFNEESFTLGDAKVAAYISTWGSWKAKNIKSQYLSDLILAFALINKSTYSSITMSGFAGLWDEVTELRETRPGLKITLSVGGASEKGFSNMAADVGKRSAFIADVCAWMRRRNLDGVDIDWEFPANAAERQNYITLLREMRNALNDLEDENGKQYSLSTAVSAAYNASMTAAAEIADSLKVMNYDYYGSWSNTTGHNANLYNNSRKKSDQSTDKSIRSYLNAGIPPEKIMLGVAFYGKVWNGVSPGSYEPGLFQSYTTYGTEPSWTSIKAAYLKGGSGYTRYWDDTANAPFLYNAAAKRWVTYSDGEQMRSLAAYAKEKKLGGVFAWEYNQDAGAELLKILAENAR